MKIILPNKKDIIKYKEKKIRRIKDLLRPRTRWKNVGEKDLKMIHETIWKM
jgi:hypothetical protein